MMLLDLIKRNLAYATLSIFQIILFIQINTKKIFSITEIWDVLIEKNNLFGYESKNNFSHVTNLEIYNKLLKNY